MRPDTLIATSVQQLSKNSNFSAKSQVFSNFLGTAKQLELLTRGYAENEQPRWAAIEACVGSAKSFLDIELHHSPSSPATSLSNTIESLRNLPSSSSKVTKAATCHLTANAISSWRKSLDLREYAADLLTAARKTSSAETRRYLAGAFSALLIEQGWNWAGLGQMDRIRNARVESDLLDYLFPQKLQKFEITFAITGVRQFAEIEKIIPGAFCWRVKDEPGKGPALLYYTVDATSRAKFRWHFSRKLTNGSFSGCFISLEWTAASGQIAAVQARSMLEGKLENYRAGGRAPHARLQDEVIYSHAGGKIRAYNDEPMHYSKSAAYPALHQTNGEIEKLFGLSRLGREAHSESVAAMYGWILFESAGLEKDIVQLEVPKLLALQEFRNDVVTLRADISEELSTNCDLQVSSAKSALSKFNRSISTSARSYQVGDDWAIAFSRQVALQLMRATSARRISTLTTHLDRASAITSLGRTADPNSWFAHLASWAQNNGLQQDDPDLAAAFDVLSRVPELLPLSADRLRAVASTLSTPASLRMHLQRRYDYFSGLLNTMYAIRNMASHEGRIGSIDLSGFGMLSGWLTDAYLEVIKNWFRKSPSLAPCIDVTLEISSRFDVIVHPNYLDVVADFSVIDFENLTQPGWLGALAHVSTGLSTP